MVYASAVQEEFASGVFYCRRPFYLSPAKLESDYAPVRFQRELRLFRAWCTGGKVLDVGCSTGGFLYQLKTRYPEHYHVLGLDLASAALEYAESRGIPVKREPFLDLDFGESRFDAITLWAVIEHLIEPKKFLDKVAQLLKPGGHCFILVPNLRSLAVRLLGPKYRYIMAEHLNYFTAATLRAFASRQETFEITALGSTHFNPVVICQDWWSGQREVPDEDRAQLLKRTTLWKQSRSLKPLGILYRGVERMLGLLKLADNLFVVLRKKKLKPADRPKRP